MSAADRNVPTIKIGSIDRAIEQARDIDEVTVIDNGDGTASVFENGVYVSRLEER